MSKKINAGDTLTVGDLTDDHLGAVIEVDDGEGTVMRFALGEISPLANGYDLYPLGSSPWFF